MFIRDFTLLLDKRRLQNLRRAFRSVRDEMCIWQFVDTMLFEVFDEQPAVNPSGGPNPREEKLCRLFEEVGLLHAAPAPCALVLVAGETDIDFSA